MTREKGPSQGTPEEIQQAEAMMTEKEKMLSASSEYWAESNKHRLEAQKTIVQVLAKDPSIEGDLGSYLGGALRDSIQESKKLTPETFKKIALALEGKACLTVDHSSAGCKVRLWGPKFKSISKKIGHVYSGWNDNLTIAGIFLHPEGEDFSGVREKLQKLLTDLGAKRSTDKELKEWVNFYEIDTTKKKK